MRRIYKSLMASVLALGMLGGSLTADAEGSADVDTPEVPGQADERLYCVGSVSKVYVTCAVMQLVDRGLVELDEPITTYIPDFTMDDPRYEQITVRMLMDHTSGIMGSLNTDMTLYDDNYRAEDRTLDSLASQRLIHDPGEYAAYCNDGFDLLEIIVENVTGTDYTEYVVENIATPVGATHTGSSLTLYRDPLNAPITISGNIPYDYDYCMCVGAGGIYSTASDVADFGSAFFEGNDVLLSSQSLDAMATRWNDEGEETDIYEESFGLGWDYVSSLAYEQAGVTVLGKGGDITNQHAFLLVAPEQEISVAVLSSGGSSNNNEMAAEAILNAALEAQGIHVESLTAPEVELAGEIPSGFRAYEGFYVLSDYNGPEYCYVSVDETEMHIQHLDFAGFRTDDYRYTTDGGFVSVDAEGVPTADEIICYFEETEDGVYITTESFAEAVGLGTDLHFQYSGERIDPVDVSEDALASWSQLSGREYVIFNSRYSSTDYDRPFGNAYTIEGLPGYVYVTLQGYGRTLMIEDETHLTAFTTMPSSANRDLVDVSAGSFALSDGSAVEGYSVTDGWNFRFTDEFPVLDSSVTSIPLYDSEAQWFVIGDDVAGSTITVDRPEESAIYVYNKFHEVVYSTHMTGISDEIPLPSGGYVMFIGRTGESIQLL